MNKRKDKKMNKKKDKKMNKKKDEIDENVWLK